MKAAPNRTSRKASCKNSWLVVRSGHPTAAPGGPQSSPASIRMGKTFTDRDLSLGRVAAPVTYRT
jgi:hypothetical protein